MPRTTEEWQEAVNLANFYRSLHDAALYGLIEPLPGINVERCDLILDEGKKIGIVPNRTAEQILQRMAAQGAG